MKQKRPDLLLLLFLLPCIPVSSQNFFQKTYSRMFRDECRGLSTAPDGGIVMAGASGPANPQKMWVQGMNSAGDILWSVHCSVDGEGVALDVERAAAGSGYWVVFQTTSTPGEPGQAGWMRIATPGQVVYSRQTTFPCLLDRITPLHDGGYLLTGYHPASSWTDAFALKIDANGEVMWQTGFGNAGDDALTACWEDAQGFIYCSGYTHDSGLGKQDALLAKLSPDGAVLWTRKFDSATDDDVFTGIAAFADGSLLLAGTGGGFGGGYKETWLVKTTAEGEFRWSRTYRLPDLELGAIDLLGLAGDQFVIDTSDPDFEVGSPAILFKASADGDLLWEYQYRTGAEREILREVIPYGSGFVAAGWATFNGDADSYLVKIAGDGLIPGSDCCPVSAGLLIRDVFPQSKVFTAGLSSNGGVTTIFPIAQPEMPAEKNLCTAIDLDFSVSDTSICPGECVDLTALGNTPGVHYYFSANGGQFDATDSTRICFAADGNYLITRTGENNLCSRNRSIRIEVGTKGEIVPNAFTPNDDGVNDTFRPVFYCPANALTFRVFNRWGQKVFETADPNTAWDGKIGGVEAPSDIYAWQMEYEALREGTVQRLKKKGDVALLR